MKLIMGKNLGRVVQARADRAVESEAGTGEEQGSLLDQVARHLGHLLGFADTLGRVCRSELLVGFGIVLEPLPQHRRRDRRWANRIHPNATTELDRHRTRHARQRRLRGLRRQR